MQHTDEGSEKTNRVPSVVLSKIQNQLIKNYLSVHQRSWCRAIYIRQRGIHLAASRKSIAIRVDEIIVRVGGLERAEVGISLDIVQTVQPRQDGLHEFRLLLVRGGVGTVLVDGLELGEPNGTTTRGRVGLLDVGGKVGDIIVLAIPMERDEVDGAAGAVAEELSQPGDAIRCSSVGHGGCAQFHVGTRKRLHEVLVRCRCLRWGQAGEVGLVECEQMLDGAGVDTGRDVALPSVDIFLVPCGIRVEQWDVFKVAGNCQG